MLPSFAMAEGKVGYSLLTDEEGDRTNRVWLNVNEEVYKGYSLGFYLQSDTSLSKEESLYGKLGIYKNVTERLNMSVFTEMNKWQALQKDNYNNKQIGVGLEYKLW